MRTCSALIPGRGPARWQSSSCSPRYAGEHSGRGGQPAALCRNSKLACYAHEMRFLRLAVGLLLSTSSLLLPARGAAYCRTTTEETISSGCPEICQTEGLPLYWPKRDLSYVLNERGFPHLTNAQVRNILERSF